jgi:hypothetical protein
MKRFGQALAAPAGGAGRSREIAEAIFPTSTICVAYGRSSSELEFIVPIRNTGLDL